MAGKGGDRNYVSVWFWMFSLFVVALPCVGIFMVIYWAFSGENETRKNYFRAIMAWYCILIGVGIGLSVMGLWPEILTQLQLLTHQHKP